MTTDAAAAAVPELLRLVAEFERPDLNQRVVAAASRLQRAETVVCVVGEFKQGKSSLVNALVRADVCPVDDDLATSVITLVQHGDEASAIVRRRDGETKSATRVPIAEVADWASEQGNPGNEKQVERVDVGVPSSLLEDGLMLVDTPGMGGLGGGHAAATMSFLPFADGLVLASDASSELTAPEIDFIRQAAELCPTVMFAQTKIDLYPAWERVFELNRGHLTRLGLDIPTVAVSSHLRTTALATRNRELNARSNMPAFIDVLRRRVIEPARSESARRARTELTQIAGLLRTGAQEELRLLENPEELQAALETLEQSKQRLEHLRGPGARWSTVLGDRIADTSTDVGHRYRSAMRRIGRSMDETIEGLARGADWEQVTRDAQTEVSEATAQAYGAIQAARSDIHREIAEHLRDEELLVVEREGRESRSLDLEEFWHGTESLQKEEHGGLAAARSVIGLGQSFGSSQYMFSNVSTISKFGISLGALAAGPVLAGGFVVMGGMKVFDDRKRKLTARRQQLRQQVRTFIDNVQFEVGNEISVMIRDIQRELRDEFVERISELQQTYAETMQRAKQDSQRSEQEVAQRRGRLGEGIAALAAAEAALGTDVR